MNTNTDNPCFRHVPVPCRVRGVGLIEVLVAVAILAFGLLGIAALQATALRNSQSSYERSQAVTLTYSILDRMRANLTVTHAGGYNTTKLCTVDPSDGTQAGNDIHDWMNEVQKVMGNTACGTINCNQPLNVYQCTITVEWDDSRGTKGDANQKLSTSTAI